jgi:hypothetical protein
LARVGARDEGETRALGEVMNESIKPRPVNQNDTPLGANCKGLCAVFKCRDQYSRDDPEHSFAAFVHSGMLYLSPCMMHPEDWLSKDEAIGLFNTAQTALERLISDMEKREMLPRDRAPQP